MSLEAGSPQERTAYLGRLNHDEMAAQLEGVRLTSRLNGGIVQVTSAQGFDRPSNSRGVYAPLLGMDPLEIHACYVQGRLMTLVAAMDGGERGGCVKLNRGIEVINGQLRPMKGASDISRVLGLERGVRARVTFDDDSPDLYVVRFEVAGQAQERRQPRLTPGRATSALDRVLGA